MKKARSAFGNRDRLPVARGSGEVMSSQKETSEQTCHDRFLEWGDKEGNKKGDKWESHVLSYKRGNHVARLSVGRQEGRRQMGRQREGCNSLQANVGEQREARRRETKKDKKP